MIDAHVLSDHRRLADDDAGTMVDAEVFTDRCTGIDVDAGLLVGILTDDPRKDRHTRLIKFVGDAMIDQSLKAGKAQNDLGTGLCGRIAIVQSFQILVQHFLHGRKALQKTIRDILMVHIDFGDLLVQIVFYCGKYVRFGIF